MTKIIIATYLTQTNEHGIYKSGKLIHKDKWKFVTFTTDID